MRDRLRGRRRGAGGDGSGVAGPRRCNRSRVHRGRLHRRSGPGRLPHTVCDMPPPAVTRTSRTHTGCRTGRPVPPAPSAGRGDTVRIRLPAADSAGRPATGCLCRRRRSGTSQGRGTRSGLDCDMRYNWSVSPVSPESRQQLLLLRLDYRWRREVPRRQLRRIGRPIDPEAHRIKATFGCRAVKGRL